MAQTFVRLDIERFPEMLAMMRAELAAILREAAADEDHRTARRLREIATAFEVGQAHE